MKTYTIFLLSISPNISLFCLCLDKGLKHTGIFLMYQIFKISTLPLHWLLQHILTLTNFDSLGGNKNREMSLALNSRLVGNRWSDIMLLHWVLHQSKINNIGSLTGQSTRNTQINPYVFYFSPLLITMQQVIYGHQKQTQGSGTCPQVHGANTWVLMHCTSPITPMHWAIVKVTTDSSLGHVVVLANNSLDLSD